MLLWTEQEAIRRSNDSMGNDCPPDPGGRTETTSSFTRGGTTGFTSAAEMDAEAISGSLIDRYCISPGDEEMVARMMARWW